MQQKERVLTDADFNVKATELALKTNTFFTTQLSGEHNIKAANLKFHWYGSFNILDQYIPDQRRIQYIQDPSSAAILTCS